MAPTLSVDEIRGLGFDWPKYALVEEYCVIQEGEVDLAATIEKLQSSRAYYKKQLNEAFNFKMQTGADYSDFTDRFDDNARMERELGEAIAYLQRIAAASEP
jgi:hypothetical protein